ncbi:hypothetical protein PVL29_026276 [Vitis rotundifolia]|uniref:Uncharacterized protein n=1 Tax=Vitis rotundifolia TaxID=103349 RepID=A0AA38YM49_VITRO|nr:hypothetical protein PVL29_026276 [Vitis rotundifolia]
MVRVHRLVVVGFTRAVEGRVLMSHVLLVMPSHLNSHADHLLLYLSWDHQHFALHLVVFSLGSIDDSSAFGILVSRSLNAKLPILQPLTHHCVRELYIESFSQHIHCKCNLERSKLGKGFMLSDSSDCLGLRAKDTQYRTAEVQKAIGVSGYRMSDTHNKRDRTIGLGAFDQLDLVVTESVIRWASYIYISPIPVAWFAGPPLSHMSSPQFILFDFENHFPTFFSSNNFQDFSSLNNSNSPIFHP